MKEEFVKLFRDYQKALAAHNKKNDASGTDPEKPYPLQPTLEGMADYLDTGKITTEKGAK